MPVPMMHQEFVRWKSLISQTWLLLTRTRGTRAFGAAFFARWWEHPASAGCKRLIRFGLQPWLHLARSAPTPLHPREAVKVGGVTIFLSCSPTGYKCYSNRL